MNKQVFNLPGGYPLETDTLEQMQKSYSLFNALGEIAGDKALIKGCEDQGEAVSDGVVYLTGELFVFRGGPKQDTVIIKEEPESKDFENGQRHEVFFRRYVSFGSGEGAMNWSEFKRYRLIEEVGELKTEVTKKATELEAEISEKVTELKSEVTDKLAGKAPVVHSHDDRYYQKYEIPRYATLVEERYYNLEVWTGKTSSEYHSGYGEGRAMSGLKVYIEHDVGLNSVLPYDSGGGSGGGDRTRWDLIRLNITAYFSKIRVTH